jgi:hypothetical protein
MKLVKFLSFVIAILVVVNVTVANRAVDQAETVSALSREISSLEHETVILQSAVAEAGALTGMSERVAALGFTETAKVATLGTASSVALR